MATEEVKETPETPTEPKVEFTPEQQKKIEEILNKRLSSWNAEKETEIKALKESQKKALERAKMDEADRLKAEADDRYNEAIKRAEDAEVALKLSKAERAFAEAGLPGELASKVIIAENGDVKDIIGLLMKVAEDKANALIASKTRTGTPSAPSGETDVIRDEIRRAAGLE